MQRGAFLEAVILRTEGTKDPVIYRFRITRFYWIGLKPQLFGSIIKMSKLIFATLAF